MKPIEVCGGCGHSCPKTETNLPLTQKIVEAALYDKTEIDNASLQKITERLREENLKPCQACTPLQQQLTANQAEDSEVLAAKVAAAKNFRRLIRTAAGRDIADLIDYADRIATKNPAVLDAVCDFLASDAVEKMLPGESAQVREKIEKVCKISAEMPRENETENSEITTVEERVLVSA